jgi:hypothetical protein
MEFKINEVYSLTNEHPASHYGIPVVVNQNGNAYGPADILPVPNKFKSVFGKQNIATNTCARFIVSWCEEYTKDNDGNILGMNRIKEEILAVALFLGQWPEGEQIDPDEIFNSRWWKLNHKE